MFRDVTLRSSEGEFLTMVGHSGCGKTTLLNIIAGLERPTEGGVVLEGARSRGPGLDRMVVFQNFALMPWMTRLRERAAGRARRAPRLAARPDRRAAQRYVEMVGLTGRRRSGRPHLSGGMRQRVGLARAFSVEPKVLLLDEPFAQIDALTRGVIQDELVRMWAASRNTVFMVTHDVDEAILLSDRIALMTSGPEARLAEIVEVKIPRPRTRAELHRRPRVRPAAHPHPALPDGSGRRSPEAGDRRQYGPRAPHAARPI